MLVDTNILVYAINSASPKQKVAQQFLQEHKNHLYIAHQNICEALRVLTHSKFSHPMNERDAIKAISRITSSLTVIRPDSGTIDIALSVIMKYHLRANLIFDAYLVATVLTNDISVIATDNVRHFRIFEEISAINPFAARSN